MDRVRTQPNHEDVLQNFVRYVEKCKQPGISGTENEKVYFCPELNLKDYFSDHNQLEGILRCVLPSTGPLPVRAYNIQTKYTKIFAILLYIGKGKFIKRFDQYNSLSDEKLPFDTCPEDFPSDVEDMDKSFFGSFYERQWMFCAPNLSYERFKNFQPRMILPIVSREELGTGGSSTTYKIEVYPAYNHLEEGRTTKDRSTDQSPNTYVLKVYNSQGTEKQRKNEVEGFVNVRSAMTGNYEPSIIGFYGSYKHGETQNVILEYANEGTLEDYFKQHPTPCTGPEIYSFWRSLLSLNRALDGIHNLAYKDQSARRGWHQDVKTDNILVSTRNGSLEFKLADLGLSHFQDRVGDTTYDWDSRGTRTYGAPECYRFDTIKSRRRHLVTSKVDIWSLGCILSEAAVWLTRGLTGLQKYRALRQENSKKHGIEDSDCFHNGEGILTCVKESLQKLPEDLRRCDEMTEPIVNMIRGDMLVAQQHRAKANTLWAKSYRIFEDAASMEHDDQNNSGPFGLSYPPVSSSTSAYPVIHVPKRRAATTSPRQERVSNGRNRKTSPLPIKKDLQRIPHKEVQHAYTQSFELIPAGRQAQIPHLSNDSSVESLSPLDRVSHDGFSAGSLPHPSPVKRSLIRTSSGGKRRPDLVTKPARIDSQHQELGPEAYTDPTADNSGSDRYPPSGQRRQPPLPILSIDEASRWREDHKKSGLKGLAMTLWKLLSGAKDTPLPDAHLIDRLKNRDHVFLIDDSTSMRDHWDDVVPLLDTLAYIVKETDQNGIDLFFTMSHVHYTNRKKTRKLVHVAEKQRPLKTKKGTEHLSDIHWRLSSILEKYQKRLKEEDQSNLNSSRNRPWHAHDPSDVRGLNLYIFTDGIWQPGADAVSPIKSLVETLEKYKKPKDQVGIQFIHFGNDREGTERLSYLDSGLEPSGVMRDIVDTEPFSNGNIWKMLLGAIDKWFDGDNTEASGTSHTNSDIPGASGQEDCLGANRTNM